MKPAEVIAFAKEHGAKMLDLKFLDFPGLWQHYRLPDPPPDEELFEDGLGFDGSSIRGWQPIHASDMLVIPDPGTARMDPFTKEPTLSLICNIVDPITREPYTRDPRNIAQKAERYLQSTRPRRHRLLRPRGRVLRLRRRALRADRQHAASTRSTRWRGSGTPGATRGPTWATSRATRRATSRCRPPTASTTCAPRWCLELEKLGIDGRGAAPRGGHRRSVRDRHEASRRWSQMGDDLMWFKYVVKNVARRNGRTATFMPKPIFGDNGSGMHVHISLWKDGKPLFAGDEYAGLSEMALHFIGGVLKHARSHLRLLQRQHQQLPPAGPGLRGADQPGLLQPQPLGRGADPDVLRLAQGQAHRVPYARSRPATPTWPSRRC